MIVEKKIEFTITPEERELANKFREMVESSCRAIEQQEEQVYCADCPIHNYCYNNAGDDWWIPCSSN